MIKNLFKSKFVITDIIMHVIFVAAIYILKNQSYLQNIAVLYILYSLIISLLNGLFSTNIEQLFFLRLGVNAFVGSYNHPQIMFAFSLLHALMLICSFFASKLQRKEAPPFMKTLVKAYPINIPCAVLGILIINYVFSYTF